MIYIKKICRSNEKLIVEQQIHNEQSFYKFKRCFVVTRSLIDLLIEYYSRSLSSILEVLVLLEIRISNSRLDIIRINCLDIKLTFRVYILNLVIVYFTILHTFIFHMITSIEKIQTN